MRAFAENPLEFMRSCIAVVTYQSKIPGKRRFKFEPYARVNYATMEETPVVGSKLGRSLPVYKLSEAGYDANYFEAFWCPYDQNKVYGVNLDNTADFFFTPQMDGCTLGMGSTAQGCVRVAHANAARVGNAAGKDGQRTTQQAMLMSEISGPMETVRPASYMADHGDAAQVLKSTTFGVRNGADDWQIYCQRYERRSPTRAFLRDLVRVV